MDTNRRWLFSLSTNVRALVARLSAMVLLMVAVMAAPGCKDEMSNPGGSVVLYTSADQEYAELVIDRFHSVSPEIEVRARYDTEMTKTTGLVERLLAETANPQADIFWSSEVFLTIRLAQEGVLQPLYSDALQDWPASMRDPDRLWYGLGARARVIGYSTERVTDPPASWQDLTDPKWKGRVVMADPNYGTTRGHIAAMYTVWGPEVTAQYLNDLMANGLRIVASNSQGMREIVAGTADLCFTDTDDVWAQQRNGQAVDLAYPRHQDGADGGTLLIPNTVAVIAGRPESAATRTFAEFMLSGDVERLLYESDSHNIPVLDIGIEVEDRYVVSDPLLVDYAQVAANMPAAMTLANEILLGH
ncbi:MAG: extracellular solute-binding protein [Planctomycetes bacterium]|nr:extracellular solute-binding protein [Planctomycetota bacterium]NOG54311.1 extracellular solute-binding protein [Planctomycetota bacterium]